MNDPTRRTMPGVRDFEVTIPFQRAGAETDTTDNTEMRVRVPALNHAAAVMLGIQIGTHVGSVNKPAAGPRWQVVVDKITTVDVDDSPSPADLAAELDHYKRIVAALATSMPMLAQVTADQYRAADPDAIQMVSLPGDTIAFVTEAGLAQLGDGMPFAEPLLMPAEQQMVPGDPRIRLNDSEALVGGSWKRVLLWNGADSVLTVREGAHDDVEYLVTPGAALLFRAAQPAPYGGYEDPDVCTVRPDNLDKLTTSFDLLLNRKWVRITDVQPPEIGVVEVTTDDAGRVIPLSPEPLCTVRPACTEGHGTDLTRFLGHQILTDDGWWTIDGKGRGGTPAGRPVKLSRGTESRDVLIGDDDQVLLRTNPQEWPR